MFRHLRCRQPRLRWAAQSLLAAVVVAAGLAATSPGASAAPSIHDGQVAVVTADHQPAIASAGRDLAGAEASLAAAYSRRAADQTLLTQAAALTRQAAAAVVVDTSHLRTDTADRNAATSAMANDDTRLGAIGVQLYVSPDAIPVDGPDALADAQQQEFATEVIDIGAGELITDLHLRRADRRRAVDAVTVDDHDLRVDRATLRRVTTLRANRTTVLGADTSAVTVAERTVARDRVVLTALDVALSRAVAALANPPGTPDDGTPSIEGISALDADQMIAWYNYEGWGDLTSAPIQELVGWYLAEGEAEGIRGDVAFAQAMVETAGFSSNDAVAFNNYAGIGHCDTCTSGVAFASPELGVRGQIQLLHSFADGSLTAAQLARPLAVASLSPQDQPDRGCCATWQSLTGKWATDPRYGQTIMGVYASMLSFALDPPQG